MFIGVSGGSGSGKTAFIKALRALFNESELGLISEDNYYKAKELQKLDAAGVINFDIPEAIDHERFIKDLNSLNNHQEVRFLEYAFNNAHSQEQWITIVPAEVYIVEGLFIFHNQDVNKMLDLKILIHANEAIKIKRRINRDKNERNYDLEDVLYRYEHHVAPSYAKYIEPYIEGIDIIINNNTSFAKGVDLLSAYIRSKLDAKKSKS